MPSRCIYSRCKNVATHGPESNSVAIACKSHKKSTHYDHSKCRVIDGGKPCKYQKTHGWPDQTLPLTCPLHSSRGMIDMETYCCVTKCNARPTHGLKHWLVPKYCFKHALGNMENITTSYRDKVTKDLVYVHGRSIEPERFDPLMAQPIKIITKSQELDFFAEVLCQNKEL